MQRIKCRVEELREYVDTIWHVALTPQQAISFKPGQYLLVVMSDSDKRPFSIANSPTRPGMLELQIGATPPPWASIRSRPPSASAITPRT